ncbi:hypothetical protein ACQB6R_01225 [Propionibacteriaceae bacterium G1746]
MNTDDLRDLMQGNGPGDDRLDGTQMLQFAKQARTRRRVVAGGMTAAAAVTAFAVAWGAGALGRTTETTPTWAGTPTFAPTTTSPSPVLPSPTTAQPSAPASSLPATLPTSQQTTRSTTSQGAVLGLCTSTTALPQLRSVAGLMAAGPGGRLLVTASSRTATVTIDNVVKLEYTVPDTMGYLGAQTDGRFVVLAVAHTANSDDMAATYYVWDSQSSGDPKQLLVTPQSGTLEVRDGHALIAKTTTSSEKATAELTLFNLAAGTSTVVHNGEFVSAHLLDGGRYVLLTPNVGAVKISGTGPAMRSGDKTMFPPFGSNGDSYVFSGASNSAGAWVWSPAMPQPLKVTDAMNTDPGVGRNFAVVRAMDNQGTGTYYLVDLRTGGRTTLPPSTGPSDDIWRITADDVLVRAPGPGAEGAGAVMDASELRLGC